MNPAYKLAMEEMIFSKENFIQNIRFMDEALREDKLPRKYVFNIKGKEIIIVVVWNLSSTTMMVTLKGSNHFRLIPNFTDNVFVISPSSNPLLMVNDLELEHSAKVIAENLAKTEKFGDYGSKIEKALKTFQLWNFHNHKLSLDI